MTITKQPALTTGLAALAGIIAKDNSEPKHLVKPQCWSPDTPETKALSKLLLNAWSAEYALRITPVVDENQYLQSSLHWTFPQAYYSALFSARALLMLVAGADTSNETLVTRKINTLVMQGYYPGCLSFYTVGAQGMYKHWGLGIVPYDNLPLLTELLTSTRDKEMHQLRNEIQNNPKTALRSESTGEVLQKFGPEQYKSLAKNAGRTTFFNLLRRLRISSNNRDLETFSGNIKEFHEVLTKIVYAVNLAHERQICHAIGQDTYQSIVQALPLYLQESAVEERLNIICQQ